MWIDPIALTTYLGSQIAFWHINSAHDCPGSQYRPTIEGGETRQLDGQTILVGAVHTGWEPLPAEPSVSSFVSEFTLPGANTLYASVLEKVAAAGFAAQDHWQNFKTVVMGGRLEEVPAAIAYLDQLLLAAGHPLSQTDISGDAEQGDPHTGWNTLCDKHHFPEDCKL